MTARFPTTSTGVARTTLTEVDIEALRVGTWVLGTGGGGDPYYGYLCLKKLYAEGRVVEVIDPMDLPDDAFVAAVNQMGSPMPAEERLTDPATVTRAIRVMEEYAGIRFTAVMPWEIGGGNAFQPLMAAAMLGLPVVDADAMGRAFPEAQMTSFAVKDFTCYPLVMADIRPNTVIISEAADWKWLERIRRRACTELGAIAATCNPPRTGHEVKTGSHLHTVSKALHIGRTIRRAQAMHEDPVAALVHARTRHRAAAREGHRRGPADHRRLPLGPPGHRGARRLRRRRHAHCVPKRVHRGLAERPTVRNHAGSDLRAR